MRKQKVKQGFNEVVEIYDSKKHERIHIEQNDGFDIIRVDYNKIPELIEKLKLFVK